MKDWAFVAGLAAVVVAAAYAFHAPARPPDFGSFLAPGYTECLTFMDPAEKNACTASRQCVSRGNELLTSRLQRASNPRERIETLTRLGDLHSYENKTLLRAAGFYEQALAALGNSPERTGKRLPVLFRLAAVQMRYGELQNCVHHHNAQSCIFPLKAQALHVEKAGSEGALGTLKEIWRLDPGNPEARWLINVVSMTLGLYPGSVPPDILLPPELFASRSKFPAFRDIATELGLNQGQFQGRTALIEDLNGDGYLDIVMSGRDFCEPMIYLENDRNGGFLDRSAESGLGAQERVFNAIQGDFDNDGKVDLYLMRGAWDGKDMPAKVHNTLMRNLGNGKFVDVTEAAGLMGEPNTTNSAVFYDFNRNGLLDLFVCNEKRGPDLFENLGNGKFRNVISGSGIANNQICKGVAVADVNGDGLPDIFLSNFNAPKKLFINLGGFKFREVPAPEVPSQPFSSFATWFFDYRNEGVPGLFLSSFNRDSIGQFVQSLYPGVRAEGPHLYRNDGKGGFIDDPAAATIRGASMTMGANFGDIDNDGFKDVYLATGGPGLNQLVPDKVYLNHGGTEFEDVTYAGGFGNLQKGHGVSFGDLDNDGYPEILVMHGGLMPSDTFVQSLLKGPGQSYFRNHWITLRLEGTRSNRSAIGAHIRVDVEEESGRARKIYHTVDSGGSFGTNPLQAQIGLGKAKRILKIRIEWPFPDSVQEFPGPALDRFYHVLEGRDRLEPLDLKRLTLRGSTGARESPP